MIDPNQQLIWNHPTPETAINGRTIDDVLREQGLIDDDDYPVDDDDIRGEDVIEGGSGTDREELEELIAELQTLVKMRRQDRGRASATRDEDRMSGQQQAGNQYYDDHPGHLVSPVLNFEEISKSRTAHTVGTEGTRGSVSNAQTPDTPGHLVAPMLGFAEISRRR